MPYQTYLSQTFSFKSCKSNQRRAGHWFARITIFFSIFLCLFISNALHACVVEIKNIKIAQAQNAHFADRPKVGWQEVKQLPDMSQQHWQTTGDQFWYQVNWQYKCDSAQEHPVNFMISHINMAGKVYFNHHLLWQDKSLVEPLSRSWNTPRGWTIPASIIPQSNNTFWIYVKAGGIEAPNLGEIKLSVDTLLEELKQPYEFKQRDLLFMSLIINFVVAIFYLMAWLVYRKEISFFILMTTLLLWSLYNFLFLIQAPLLNSSDLDRIISAVFTTYNIVGCFAIWRFGHLRFKRIESSLLIFLGIVIASLILSPQAYLAVIVQVILLCNLIIFLLIRGSYLFLIYERKQIDLYTLGAIEFIYLIPALHDAYQFMSNQHQFWSPYVSPFAAISIGLILALRLYRNNKIIETFNQQLQEKIAIALNQREEALQMKHKLELENTKLQERMNLAHDLHDSLGGSLVRSMTIVDQSSTNLSNHQFLSMLKVLRDDLRQIIDHGSSSTAHIPKTPKLWGAPVRYRFSQIFDEIGITSTWHLPEEWQYKPNPLECLTYLRILEEALTNVLKHSQAKNVEVNLYFNLSNQMILEIIDDGIGLNTDHLFKSNLSVGLRSMQLRAEKIGAILEITSDQNFTCIKVISKLN